MQRDQAIELLQEAGKRILSKDLTWGTAGNLSIRMDEDQLLITASGTQLGDLSPEDFTVYTLSSGACSGGKPSKELPVHAAVYRACPWARAVLHASPPYATLASLTDMPVRNDLFVENMYYLQRTKTLPYYHPGSDALTNAVAEATPHANVLLLAHHGVLVYDTSVAEACTALDILEQTCRMQMTARGAGIPLSGLSSETIRDFLLGSGYKPTRPWADSL